MPPDESWSVRLVGGHDDYRPQETRLIEALEARGYSKAATFAVRLAFEEAMVNAIKHGRGHEGEVALEVSVSPSRVEIVVEDPGPGFDPDDVPDPLAPENLESPSGRGIMLMRQYMTTVEYNDKGNRVRLVYEPGG